MAEAEEMATPKAVEGESAQASQEQIELAFSGPALLSNKVYITVTHAGMRLAFMEGSSSGQEYLRTAVLLPFQDAFAFSDLLAKMLATHVKVIKKDQLGNPNGTKG